MNWLSCSRGCHSWFLFCWGTSSHSLKIYDLYGQLSVFIGSGAAGVSQQSWPCVVENQHVAGPNSTSFSSLSDVTPSNCWPVFSETWDGPHFTVPLLQDTIACIIPQECTFLLVFGSSSSSSSGGALHTQVVSLLIWNKVYTKENDVHFGMKYHQRNEMTPLYERPLGGNNHWDIWPWEDWCTAETHIVF